MKILICVLYVVAAALVILLNTSFPMWVGITVAIGLGVLLWTLDRSQERSMEASRWAYWTNSPTI